jgi:hypothetical protein
LGLGHFAAKPLFTAVRFVWISLDSLVRIETYQWVTRQKPSKSFARRFFRGEGRRNGTLLSRPCAAQDCSSGKLTSVSDFPQLIVF